MQADRRRSPRLKLETLVYLRFGDACALPAIVLDLNEEGVAIQAADTLPSAQLPLRFILPGTAHLIEGTGEVVWADENGRAGILFKELSASCRRQLKNWMAKGDRKKAATRLTTRPQKARAAVTSAH